ncbi:hypothetical protein NEUTE2DRAFT_61350, partial [Neurospora tetrasperma FGSC 2509]
FLFRFNFLIKYTLTSKNLRPDTLNRKINNRPNGEENGRFITYKRLLFNPL